MLISSGPYRTATPVEDESPNDVAAVNMKSLLHNLLDHKAEQSTIDLKNDWDRFTRSLHIDMTNRIF